MSVQPIFKDTDTNALTTVPTTLATVAFASSFQQILQQQKFLLTLFNRKNKWQLWLSERPILKRQWIERAGLDCKKVMHIGNLKQDTIVDTIEKALLNGKFSYIAACISQLSDIDKQRLQRAVMLSNTHLFLVSDQP